MVDYNWKSKCGCVFDTRRKMQAHQKECTLCINIKPSITKVERNCPFCKKIMICNASTFSLHVNHCNENPNAKKFIGHKVSEETKRKTSISCKKRGMGGYRKGSGRGKKGTYKGYYCDSSWELAYVVYNLEHSITFRRNEELFPYNWNNEVHYYKPDFIEGDTFIEIKGYFTEQVKAKSESFPYKLRFLDKNSIKPYLDYVINKYGNDFIRLYEDIKYERLKNIKAKHLCPYCNHMVCSDSHDSRCLELKEKRALSKAQKQNAINKKREQLKLLDKVDSLGRLNGNMLSNDEWEKRKELILSSGVDLTEFGCLSKIEKITGLTRRQVKSTMEKFGIPYKTHNYG